MKSSKKFFIILITLSIILMIQYYVLYIKDGTDDLIDFENNRQLLNSFLETVNVDSYNRKYNYYLLTFVGDFNFCCRSGKIIQFLDSLSIEHEDIKTCVFLPPTFSEQDVKNLRENYTLNINFYLTNNKQTPYNTLFEVVVLANSNNQVMLQTNLKTKSNLNSLKRFLIDEKL